MRGGGLVHPIADVWLMSIVTGIFYVMLLREYFYVKKTKIE